MTSIINTFILSLKKISRNKLLNAFIVFQIGLSICVAYLVYSMVAELNELPRVYKSFYNSNTYYIAPRMDYGTYNDIILSAQEEAIQPYADILNSPDTSEEQLIDAYVKFEIAASDILSEEVPKFINSIPYLKKVYTYENSPFISDGVNNVDFMTKETAQKLNYKMQSGKWLTDVETNNEYLPVVVNNTSTYNVNDVIDLDFDRRNGSSKTVRAVVVGKTKEKCSFSLQMTVGGSYSFSDTDQLDSIISQSNDFTDSAFMCISDENTEKLLEGIIKEQNTHFIIELQNGLSEEQQREVRSYFQDNGIFFWKFDDLYDNSDADFKILIRQKSVLIGCALLITFIGLIGFIILSLYKDKKITHIYNVIGMNFLENLLINLFYAVILICLAIVTFIIFLIVIGFMDYNSFIDSYSYNYFRNSGISFDISCVDFINIPYEFILYAFCGTSGIFAISSLISYLLVHGKLNNRK